MKKVTESSTTINEIPTRKILGSLKVSKNGKVASDRTKIKGMSQLYVITNNKKDVKTWCLYDIEHLPCSLRVRSCLPSHCSFKTNKEKY